MELAKIERLLERYEEGQTSLAEEKQLSEYFRRKEVPAHLMTYKMMFQFVGSQRAENYEEIPGLDKKKSNWRSWSSIAAILIVALGLFFFNQSNQLAQNDLGTISDEELALQKTKETLNMVSEIMNQGTADLAYLKEFNNTQKKIIQID